MRITKSRNGIPLFVGLDNFSSRPGGLGRVFESICKEFEENGQVFRRIEIGSSFLGKQVKPEQLIVNRIYWLLRAAFKVRNSTSLIYGHFALHTYLVALVINAPVISFFHGPWAMESEISEGKRNLRFIIKRQIEKKVYKKSSVIHCASESFRQILVLNYGLDEKKIVLCPLGVDLNRFTIKDRNTAREKLLIDKSEKIFISVRRLTNRMGLEDLIYGFSEFCSTNSDGVLYIIGKGPKQEMYENLIKKLKLQKRIVILGAVSDQDLPYWYAAANLSIVPSRFLEGFGLVALESLASGVPVLASRCGGLEEIIEKWNSEFLFDPGHHSQIAQKLREFSGGILKVDSTNCREYAEQFSWKNCFQAIQSSLSSKRILFLNSEDVISGAELSLLELIKRFSSNHFSEIFVGGKGPLYNRLSNLGLNLEYVPNLALNLSRYSKKVDLLKALPECFKSMYILRTKISKSNCEYVFINTFKTLVVAFPSMIFSSKIFIFWAHDSFDLTSRFRLLKKIFYFYVLRRSRIRVVCNSKYTAETLHKLIGINSDFVLYPILGESTKSFKEHKINVSKLGICSRITEWKGQLFAIEALLPILISYPEICLEILGSPIFGDDEYARKIENFIEKNGLSNKVKLIPFQENPHRIISNWDLSIHSSILPEPFGRTVAESINLGVPVVVPNAGGLLEIVDIDINSMTYILADQQDLHNKVKLFLDDATFRTKLQENCRSGANKFQGEEQVKFFETWLGDISK